MVQSPKTLIYGSCVSRDVVRFSPECYQLNYYIARQSWVSSNSKASRNPGETNLGQGFQQRSLIGDFASNANGLITKFGSDSDLILMDIASDRRGVYRIAEDEYISFTGELGRSRLLTRFPNKKFVGFGSDQHFEMFQQAAQRIIETINQLSSQPISLILKFDFTDESIEGQAVPTVLSTKSDEWNRLYERYYDYLQNLGFTLIDLPKSLSISTKSHEWGIGQDHFIDDAYLWWNDAISGHLLNKRS